MLGSSSAPEIISRYAPFALGSRQRQGADEEQPGEDDRRACLCRRPHPQDELTRYLDHAEMANGFANHLCLRETIAAIALRARFLAAHWIGHSSLCTPGCRTSRVPASGAWSSRALRGACGARNTDRSRRTVPASGAVTARSEAQCSGYRSSTLCSMRRCLRRVDHRRAAPARGAGGLALAACVPHFGRTLGDPVADEILRPAAVSWV